MTEFFLILLVSVPIFYVWGLISFIRFLRRQKDETTASSERQFDTLSDHVIELKRIASKNPKKTITELVKEYEHWAAEQPLRTGIMLSKVDEDTDTINERETDQTENTVTLDWKNWIHDNSINLLLYLGAFLIVAAASIFVSFAWQSFSGIFKGTLLTLLLSAFFIVGMWFYTIPKIRNAGSTFIGICAMLIPICGAGWYTFVLKDMGITAGSVWLLTSLVALIIYIALALYFKNAFYSYLTGISTISLSFSFVNTYQLQSDFYILGAMLSSFTLLITSLALKRLTKQEQVFVTKPLSLTAHVTLPAALLYGLIIASGSNQLFTLPSSLSLLLAALFYLVTYIVFKQTWPLLIAQVLLSLSIGFFGTWIQVQNVILIYLLMLFAMYEIFAASLFRRHTHEEESQAITVVAMIKITCFFLLALSFDISSLNLLFYAVCGALAGCLAGYLRKHVIYVGYAIFAITVATYIAYVPLANLYNYFYGLGLIYSAFGVCCYTALIAYKERPTHLQLFATATSIFFALSTILTFGFFGYELLVSLIIVFMLFVTTYFFKKIEFIYAANFFLSFSLLNLLQALRIDYMYYPLAYSALYLAYYCASIVVPEEYQKTYRFSSLCGLVLTPIVGAFYSFAYDNYLFFGGTTHLERYALISGYVAVLIYALDAVRHRSSKMGYTASALAMVTYLWQISIFNISETQIYTLPISCYFFVLSYLQNRVKQIPNRDVLAFVGILFLLFPSFVQSFGTNGITYALLFGGEGIVLFSVGITLRYRLATYSGICAIVLAVISQTYQYVLHIPRWVIVGSVGLIFLITAIYLLLHRSETGAKEKR